MNICSYFLGLEKSLNTALHSAQVQGLNSTAACVSVLWKGWIFRGNWHFRISGAMLIKVESTRGREMRSQLKCKRDQKDKEETELGTETTRGQRGGGFIGRV